MGPIRFLFSSISDMLRGRDAKQHPPSVPQLTPNTQAVYGSRVPSQPSFLVLRLKRLQTLLSFAPLFVVNALQQTNYHLGFGVAAGLAVLSLLLERVLLSLGQAKVWPKQLECWLTFIYALLFGLTWARNGTFVDRWYILCANGALTLVTLAGMLVQRPFTLDFAKETAPEQFWSHPRFLIVNQIITAAWVASFAITTASNAVVAAKCKVAPGSMSCRAPKAIDIIFSYILPFGSLVCAALFTRWFIARARNRAHAAMAASGQPDANGFMAYAVDPAVPAVPAAVKMQPV